MHWDLGLQKSFPSRVCRQIARQQENSLVILPLRSHPEVRYNWAQFAALGCVASRSAVGAAWLEYKQSRLRAAGAGGGRWTLAAETPQVLRILMLEDQPRGRRAAGSNRGSNYYRPRGEKAPFTPLHFFSSHHAGALQLPAVEEHRLPVAEVVGAWGWVMEGDVGAGPANV